MNTNPKKKILIVEDDQLMHNVLKDTLTNEGFEVLSSTDGASGLEAALRNRPDIIMLDMLLPKKFGVGVIREIKIQQPDLINRIIVMTNAAESQYLAEAMEAGVTTYVIKGEHDLKDMVKKVKEKLGM